MVDKDGLRFGGLVTPQNAYIDALCFGSKTYSLDLFTSSNKFYVFDIEQRQRNQWLL